MFPKSSRLVGLFTISAVTMIVAIVLAGGFAPASDGLEPVDSIAAAPPPGLVSSAKAATPDVVVARSAFVQPEVHPTPTRVVPQRTIPYWVRVKEGPISLPSLGKDPELVDTPQGAYLKVLEADEDSFLVAYGGDGRELDPAKGWVHKGNVSSAGAPSQVAAIETAVLRAEAGTSGEVIATVPAGTVLDVVEDRGNDIRVFDLGDGLGRDAAEGWIEADYVGPSSWVAAGEDGVRRLRPSQVAALRQGDGVWLKVPYRSQLDKSPAALANCGPASIAMILSHYGRYVPTTDARSVAEKLQGTPYPDVGFAIEFLAGAVEQFGLEVQGLQNGKDLKAWSLDDVRNHLRLGHPVVPQLRFRLMPGRDGSEYSEDHYVVLTGVIGDDFIYNDPVDSDGPGYGRLMSAGTFKEAWGGSYFPFAAFAVASH